MLTDSFLFSGAALWVLEEPDGHLRTRFRYASMEPPGAEPAFCETPTPPVEGARLVGLRALVGRVSPSERAAIRTARSLLEWRRTHRRCPVCGTPLQRDADPHERAMRCPACGAAFYPRVDPSVIVLVTKGDEVLLEHNTLYARPYATLVAGHVEAGESAEEAVVREVREETGVRVKDVRYVGSQAWPFPSSLMLAFRAEWAGGDPRPDGVEVDRCGWFRRDALPPLPPPPSIAAEMIAAWLREAEGRRET